MGKKYRIDEGSAAVITALSALLNADIAAMVAENQQRKAACSSPAYTEDSFVSAIKPLKDCMKSLEINEGELP